VRSPYATPVKKIGTKKAIKVLVLAVLMPPN
jgi:hypothetical protein